ncbi:heavy-metal-associated domain-containing protein [Flavobacteriaceae bacterium]|nr:heavy-metal-associated domain-containing protein [Flavobacteriaceae bacterium]
MEQQLYIRGMTCQNCRKGVMEKVNGIPGVSEVEVSLETGLAVFESERKIALDQIQNILGKKYTVTETNNPISKVSAASVSKFKALFPLFLIFGYLFLATLFLTQLTNADLEQSMLYFMGLFFIVFSFFKFLDYGGFPDSFARYDPLAKKSRLYAKIYPFIETALGIAFLLSWQLPIAIGITLVILSSTTYGVLQSILNKSAIQCACLGTALKLPMTEATLIENGIMIVMSCILILGYIL